MTPNQFELEALTGASAPTIDVAKRLVADLQGRMRDGGPRAVLVTSLSAGGDRGQDTIDLLVGAGGRFHRLRTPRFAVDLNGAGDLIAALFLFHVLRSGDAVDATARAASAVWGVIRATEAARSRELMLVAAQEEIVRPSRLFRPEPV